MKERSLKEKIKENESAVIMARKVLVDELNLDRNFKWTPEIKNQICHSGYIKSDCFSIKQIIYTLDTGEIMAIISFVTSMVCDCDTSTVKIKPEDLEYYEEPKEEKVGYEYELHAQSVLFSDDPNYLYVRKPDKEIDIMVEEFIEKYPLKTIKEVFGAERKGVQLKVVFQCLKDIYDRLEKLDRWENE